MMLTFYYTPLTMPLVGNSMDIAANAASIAANLMSSFSSMSSIKFLNCPAPATMLVNADSIKPGS